MTTFEDGVLCFDPTDWASNVSLMLKHSEFKQALMGRNTDGETVWIHINKDNITVQTFQDNGFIRENIYYSDGTSEELFTH